MLDDASRICRLMQNLEIVLGQLKMLLEPFFRVDLAQAEVQPDTFGAVSLPKSLQPVQDGIRIDVTCALFQTEVKSAYRSRQIRAVCYFGDSQDRLTNLRKNANPVPGSSIDRRNE